MIKKKYTYAFFEFVFGKYIKNKVMFENLFDSMTFQEKKDILEFNFDKLWRKIVNYIPNSKQKNKFQTYRYRYEDNEKETEIYYDKKQQFNKLITDNSKRLKELIYYSKSSDPIWEVPKGRPNLNELPLNTAIREFTEETTYESDNYNIMIDIPSIKINYQYDKCFYINEYFIAFAKPEWYPQLNFYNYDSNKEIEEIKWISYDEIKYLNKGQHTAGRMINLFNILQKILLKYRKTKHAFFTNSNI